ncbi:VOC family protein [Ravibacter arvi]|uniref:VOC family protein n=1 Tax=Ravibacter arvi TaxID=2051041 RepID=A0ABP8LQS5_9BACT
MQIKSLHHIAIICSDYPKSKAFYTEILGFNVVREIYREERASYKCDLSLNGRYLIELFSFPDPPERPSYPEARGLRHLAFEVENVDEAAAFLKKHGVVCEPVRLDATTEKRFTFFADPDGLPLEFYEG